MVKQPTFPDIDNKNITIERALGISEKRLAEISHIAIEIFEMRPPISKAQVINRLAERTDLTNIERVYLGYKMYEWILKKKIPQRFHYLLQGL